MEQVDRKAFAAALFATAEIYDRKVSDAIAAVYFDDLKDYPLDAVLAAFTAHRRDADRGRFFPKVADLIDKLDGSLVDRAAVAWAEAVRLSHDCETARSKDPLTEQTVAALGGWLRLGRSDEFGLRQLAKEFERMYAANAKRSLVGMLSSLGRTNGPRLVLKSDE